MIPSTKSPIVFSSVLLELIAASTVGVLQAEASSATAAIDSCTKQIFNRYCLGGTQDTLPTSIDPVSSVRGAIIYRVQDEKKHLKLTLRNGRIDVVSRRESPGGWLNFTAWKAKLGRLYGRGEQIGQFPAYATSRSSRLNAINAGKGYAHWRWQQLGWSVSLIWDHRDYITLRYKLSDGTVGGATDEGL